MSILILALTLLVSVLGIRWFLRRAPKRGKFFLLQLLLISLALLGIWLALSGRLHWLLALFSSLLPFISRLLPLLLPLLRWLPRLKRQRSRSGQQQAGQQSTVSTRWLAMTLDHDSGSIEGRIIAGPFAGQNLVELSDQQLLQLYRQASRQDPEAVALLDSYIARHRPHVQASSHEQQSSTDDPHDTGSGISTAEAFAILGLKPGASEQQIIQAHKRMMQKVHPDRGGSNYLAAKINQAKQQLLR